MTRCSEYELDDLTAITAIPVTDYNPGTAAWQLKTTIPASAFSPVLDRSVTIGLRPAAAGASLVPIVRTTGKASDDEGDSVAGRLHTVKASCQADDRDGLVWADLLHLERTPCHRLLTFRGGTRAFAQATSDAYICTVERSGAKTTVIFRLQNLMGIQLLT